VLKPRHLADLSWHPLKDVGRSDNYALSVWGYAQGRLHYLMACGHRSVPGHAVCERGCLRAPNFRTPHTPAPWLDQHAKFMARHKVQTFEDGYRIARERLAGRKVA
jgi:hypothetical protein